MPFFMFSFYLSNAVAGGPVFILALCPASAHPTCAAAVATLEGAGNQPPPLLPLAATAAPSEEEG